MELTDMLLGPVGGAVAIGVGIGWLAGYAFAKKNVTEQIDRLDRNLEEEKASCDRRIESLKEYYDREITRLNDRIQQLEGQFSAFIRPPYPNQ